MNENCNISNSAFSWTPLENNYTENMGPDARCFDEGYNYCN